MKLLFISIVSVFFCFSVITGARIWGQAQVYPAFEHPFTQVSAPWKAVWVETIEEAQRAVELDPNIILVTPVRVSKDYKLFVMNNQGDHKFIQDLHDLQVKNPQTPILKGGRLSDYELSDIEKSFGVRTSLVEFLKKFEKQRFILQILDNAEGVHVVLRDTLKPLLINDRILISSDADVIVESTKELMPEWLYGSGQGAVMRMLSFESIGLESAIPFKGDILVTPLAVLNRPTLNLAVSNEVHRRNKKVILGPLNNESEVETAVSLKADGFIFKNVELARKFDAEKLKGSNFKF